MSARAITAAFNAIVMVAAAFTITGGSFADPHAGVVIWGSAAAAVVAALTVLTRAPAVLGWAALGYILFAALLAVVRPVPLLLLLVLAFAPLLERPRRSLLLGIATSSVVAVVLGAVSRSR